MCTCIYKAIDSNVTVELFIVKILLVNVNICHSCVITLICMSNLQLQFLSPTTDEFDSLQCQMKARISEGQGETIYEIGTGGSLF